MTRTTTTPLNAMLNGEPACICKAWTIHCGCGKSVSHKDMAKLRREARRLREITRWRDAKKEPPPPMTWVSVVCVGDTQVFQAYRRGKRWFDSEGEVSPSHWLPFPPLPWGTQQ